MPKLTTHYQKLSRFTNSKKNAGDSEVCDKDSAGADDDEGGRQSDVGDDNDVENDQDEHGDNANVGDNYDVFAADVVATAVVICPCPLLLSSLLW